MSGPSKLGSHGLGKLSSDQKTLALVRNGLHWCKRGFGWCIRLLGELCSLVPEDLRTFASPVLRFSGTRKGTNPNFRVRIFAGGVGVFHMNGWGPKNSVCPSKPGKSNFWAGYPGIFARKSWGCPKRSLAPRCLIFGCQFSRSAASQLSG